MSSVICVDTRDDGRVEFYNDMMWDDVVTVTDDIYRRFLRESGKNFPLPQNHHYLTTFLSDSTKYDIVVILVFFSELFDGYPIRGSMRKIFYRFLVGTVCSIPLNIMFVHCPCTTCTVPVRGQDSLTV